MKRRKIPTLPIDFFKDVDNKQKYQKMLYGSILDGVEQTLANGKPSFVMARIDDGRKVRDVTISYDSYESNLKTVLEFYEKNEEYELCSRTLELLNEVL